MKLNEKDKETGRYLLLALLCVGMSIFILLHFILITIFGSVTIYEYIPSLKYLEIEVLFITLIFGVNSVFYLIKDKK